VSGAIESTLLFLFVKEYYTRKSILDSNVLKWKKELIDDSLRTLFAELWWKNFMRAAGKDEKLGSLKNRNESRKEFLDAFGEPIEYHAASTLLGRLGRV
jgi:hypothetical protein